MSHLHTTDSAALAALDTAALEHARALQASLSGLRMEDPPAPADPAPSDPPADPAPSDPPADPPADPQPDLTQQALDAITQLQQAGTQIPDALQAAVQQLKDARGEAANYRTQLRDVQSKQTQHDETMQAIAKALGLAKDGDDPDPEQLQQTLTQKDQQLRTKTIELAVHSRASQADGDPNALLDSRTFMEEAAKLDPDGDKFSQELDSLIKTTVEKNPKLKAGQAPPRGGSDFTTTKPDNDPGPGVARLRKAYATTT